LIYPKNRFEFTVKEVSKACGVSRSTLIRMEESGFLTPYRIDPVSGYRYYDSQNIAQIGQYQLLQELGLSRKEITDFYFQKVDIKEFIQEQKKRVNRLQRLLQELEMRYTREQDYTFSYIDLPEVTCYCVSVPNVSPEMAETNAYELHQNLLKQGFCPNGAEPFFGILNLDGTDASFTICIPVKPPAKPDPRVQTFPACQAFSVMGHGDYDVIFDLAAKLREEVVARKLKPAGPARVISLVAPYVGAHICPENFCHEFVLPIEITK